MSALLSGLVVCENARMRFCVLVASCLLSELSAYENECYMEYNTLIILNASCGFCSVVQIVQTDLVQLNQCLSSCTVFG